MPVTQKMRDSRRWTKKPAKELNAAIAQHVAGIPAATGASRKNFCAQNAAAAHAITTAMHNKNRIGRRCFFTATTSIFP